MAHNYVFFVRKMLLTNIQNNKNKKLKYFKMSEKELSAVKIILSQIIVNKNVLFYYTHIIFSDRR